MIATEQNPSRNLMPPLQRELLLLLHLVVLTGITLQR